MYFESIDIKAKKRDLRLSLVVSSLYSTMTYLTKATAQRRIVIAKAKVKLISARYGRPALV